MEPPCPTSTSIIVSNVGQKQQFSTFQRYSGRVATRYSGSSNVKVTTRDTAREREREEERERRRAKDIRSDRRNEIYNGEKIQRKTAADTLQGMKLDDITAKQSVPSMPTLFNVASSSGVSCFPNGSRL